MACLSDIKNYLECPICQDSDKDLYLINCQHNLCLACIETLQKNGQGGKFNCPECREPQTVPLGGFRKNRLANNLREAVEIQAVSRSKSNCSLVSHTGSVQPVDAICLRCSLLICAKCALRSNGCASEGKHEVVLLEDAESQMLKEVQIMKEEPQIRIEEAEQTHQHLLAELQKTENELKEWKLKIKELDSVVINKDLQRWAKARLSNLPSVMVLNNMPYGELRKMDWINVGGWTGKYGHAEEFYFFGCTISEFSQEYLCNFKSDGVTYNSSMQYMMNKKALLFGDHECAKAIMSCEHAVEQKLIGRDVNGFNQQVWDKNCLAIVKKGNYCKFKQNPALSSLLMETAGKTLVFTEPRNQRWGIGLRVDDPLAKKRSTWRGWNLLGEILTEIRQEILQEAQEYKPIIRRSGTWAHVGGWTGKYGLNEQFFFFDGQNSAFAYRMRCEFKVDSVTYNCAVQYTMQQKALLFGDTKRAKAIMATSDAAKQRALGRDVKGFDERRWIENCITIVKKGNYHKIRQNAHIYSSLMEMSGKTLVYAEPFDETWGIGLSINDPLTRSRSTWRGWNLLGEILTELREELAQEECKLQELRSRKQLTEQ